MQQQIALTLALATLVSAQVPSETDLGLGQKMKQNAEALKQYSFKRRTEIKVKDQSRGARVDLVRYVDGKMETVPLEAPARAQTGGGGRRGLRGKIVEKKIEKKKEEMKEERERLVNLLHSYTSPDSGAMRKVLENAKITRTGAGADAQIKLVATGLVKPSDSFTLVWSPANRRPVSIDIQAESQGKPVRLTIEYATLPNGPFYAARTVISAPKKHLLLTLDTFDYTKAGDAASR